MAAIRQSWPPHFMPPFMTNQPIFLGAASFEAGNGGLARLARLTATAAINAGVPAEIQAYLDRPGGEVAGRPVNGSSQSKLRFLTKTYLAALRGRHAFYDSVGVARAHPALPGFAQPFGLWMNGIEVWKGLRQPASSTLRRADLRLAVSQYTLDQHEALHGPCGPVSVCWLGTAEDEAPPPNARPRFTGAPTVLVVGRLERSAEYAKGQHDLIRCWPAVASAVRGARLVIVGGGPGLQSIRDEVAGSPHASSIEVTGFVDEDRIQDYWRQAHVFAMPSRGEGFGFVYVEAMRHGLPVIASVHDAGSEVNSDGESGFNISLDRQGELPERLIHLLRNQDACRQMGEAAQQRWRREFSFSVFAGRFAPHLRALLEMRK